MAAASRSGTRSTGCAGRPVRARWFASKVASSSAASTADTPSPFQATTQRPDRRVEAGVAVGQADVGQHVRGEAGRSRHAEAGQRRLHGSIDRWSCGHLLALVPLGGLERRAQQREAAMDLRLDGALGSIEGDGEFGIAEAVDVPEHDGASIGGWQRQQEVGPVGGGIAVASAMAAGPRGFFDAAAPAPPAARDRATGPSSRPAAAGRAATGTG